MDSHDGSLNDASVAFAQVCIERGLNPEVMPAGLKMAISSMSEAVAVLAASTLGDPTALRFISAALTALGRVADAEADDALQRQLRDMLEEEETDG